MCFSATASFLTTGLTAAMGLASLRRAKTWRELPLALAPVFFAVQQGLEGLLWLNLPAAPDGSLSTGLAFLFLVLAEAFWPIYAPIAVMLIEPNQGRRRLILACVAAGLGVGTYLLWYIVNWPHGAVIQDGHIVYINGTKHGVVVALAYSDEAGHRFRFEAGQSFRFHSGRCSDLKPAIFRTDPGSR
ncbi:DUF6629 family protein [Mesorhizobium jarvisii]|uniref:DUF6629 family protein n=1 Tax=Mesorhizobium jarvisii TaxID=1777867 RepID=UPI001F0AA4CA|nr:DUF6629 family protein [Mesorhizobium jarvisii]MCH4561442.1 hypothetical protein [Mesorhizobium jarvisii]